MNDDVRPGGFEGFGEVALHAHAEAFGRSGHITEIAAGFRRIDIDRTDDREPGPGRNLSNDCTADRAKAGVQHANF